MRSFWQNRRKSRLSRKGAGVTLEGPPPPAGLLRVGDRPCQPKHLILPVGLPSRPNLSAAIISPMAAVSAITGLSETFATQLDDRCLFGCAGLARGRALLANGPMRLPANTATFST